MRLKEILTAGSVIGLAYLGAREMSRQYHDEIVPWYQEHVKPDLTGQRRYQSLQLDGRGNFEQVITEYRDSTLSIGVTASDPVTGRTHQHIGEIDARDVYWPDVQVQSWDVDGDGRRDLVIGLPPGKSKSSPTGNIPQGHVSLQESRLHFGCLRPYAATEHAPMGQLGECQ